MDNHLIQELERSLRTGFIDASFLSNTVYVPELLVNSKVQNTKVLTTIERELKNCQEFLISVAFVTTSGIAPLINHFKYLGAKGVKGKILVSQYLNFTQPEALKRLLQFKNIELKIATQGNFHSKGYLFKRNGHYNIVIGSSNLTATALATNKEWNLKVSATTDSSMVNRVLSEFKSEFDFGVPVTKEFITKYKEVYDKQRTFERKKKIEEEVFTKREITPNLMQKEALVNIHKLRNEGENKALLISATGTGKTYFSAFDAQAFNPSKLLFVVHRQNIALAAMKTFRSVFGESKTMGLYSGSTREIEKDFIFSTIQTISKEHHLKNFAPSYFDYIIIDESHRSGAKSYEKLLDYFSPKFLLGMTATPERTDGLDIFKLFGHNIAYEIRLHQAMEEEILSPFHYYGVTDISVDNKLLEEDADFLLLTSQERVDRIIEKTELYGCDNGIVRGLVFCSNIKECIELSVQFNLKGYKTISLTGANSEEERINAINQLENKNLQEKLDYIFTVDIFNEGIDIPKVNQVIMIRPTQSAIVFVQQLGRGLRKSDDKNYLTVIDFIGNYKNNYLVPIALYGDTSYNKDKLRKLISEGSRMIPGTSTINFDEITKERIFKSIDSAKMQLLTELRKDYNLLKFKIGKVPMMMDFIDHGSRDPYLYVDRSRSFFNFVHKEEKDFDPDIDQKSIKLLELFSKEINNAKRVEESLILKMLLEKETLKIPGFKSLIKETYGYHVSDETIQSCIDNLNFKFAQETKDKKRQSAGAIYGFNIIDSENQNLYLNPSFKTLLKNKVFKKYLTDNIKYSITTFSQIYDQSKWQNGFILYEKYSRKDVFRILNVDKNPLAQNVGGYLVSPDKKHCPIFVNYHKEEGISESTKYEDEFVNPREFNWMSKSNRKLESNDVKAILDTKSKIRLPLFIKKSNDEDNDFYYMGEVSPKLDQVEQTTIKNDKGKDLSVVKIRFDMQTPVSDSLYNYLCQEKEENILIPEEKLETPESSLRIVPSSDVQPYINCVPLYNIQAAAGDFSEAQFVDDVEWVALPEDTKPNPYLFVCKVVGESMNKTIPNGSFCLFRKDQGGSRNGKIVLVQHHKIQETHFGSGYTVKKYQSTKNITEEGWQHLTITLKPNSTDSNFEDIVLSDSDLEELKVIGIFAGIIK